MKRAQTVFIVDSFTNKPFGGNPAAVCVFKEASEFTDDQMLRIAAEMNHSETCFCYNIRGNLYSLRWFTPTVEVPLCGHGTLATAHILLSEYGLARDTIMRFQTLKGELTVRQTDNGHLEMDFPAGRPVKIQLEDELARNTLEALGLDPIEDAKNAAEWWQCNGTRKLILVARTQDTVLRCNPNGQRLLALKYPSEHDVKGVVVTAPPAEGDASCDFVSRYFSPWNGIPEDPVTGGSHTALAVCWSKRLGKNKMTGFQMSRRGGYVGVTLQPNDRVLLAGTAVTTLKGTLSFYLFFNNLANDST